MHKNCVCDEGSEMNYVNAPTIATEDSLPLYFYFLVKRLIIAYKGLKLTLKCADNKVCSNCGLFVETDVKFNIKDNDKSTLCRSPIFCM